MRDHLFRTISGIRPRSLSFLYSGARVSTQYALALNNLFETYVYSLEITPQTKHYSVYIVGYFETRRVFWSLVSMERCVSDLAFVTPLQRRCCSVATPLHRC